MESILRGGRDCNKQTAVRHIWPVCPVTDLSHQYMGAITLHHQRGDISKTFNTNFVRDSNLSQRLYGWVEYLLSVLDANQVLASLCQSDSRAD